MAKKSKDDEFLEVIGYNIRMLRKNNDVSQLELRDELGFSSSGTISQLEQGKRELRPTQIRKIAKFFGIHPAALISRVDIENKSNDIILLSKIAVLFETKREKPQVAQPLINAINSLIENLPVSYWASLRPNTEKV